MEKISYQEFKDFHIGEDLYAKYSYYTESVLFLKIIKIVNAALPKESEAFLVDLIEREEKIRFGKVVVYQNI